MKHKPILLAALLLTPLTTVHAADHRMIEEVKEAQLFDLKSDPGETTSVAARHSDIVAKLMQRIGSARADLGDMDVVGSDARFFDNGPRKIEDAPKGKK